MKRWQIVLIVVSAFIGNLAMLFVINCGLCVYTIASYILSCSQQYGDEWRTITNAPLKEVTVESLPAGSTSKEWRQFGFSLRLDGYKKIDNPVNPDNGYIYQRGDDRTIMIIYSENQVVYQDISTFSEYDRRCIDKAAGRKIQNYFDFNIACNRATLSDFSIVDLQKCKGVLLLLTMKTTLQPKHSSLLYEKNENERALIFYDIDRSIITLNNPSNPQTDYGMVFKGPFTEEEICGILASIKFDDLRKE